MDWHKWHGLYEDQPALQRRLKLVRDQIARCLSACPPGRIDVLSVCAGDGRDLLGVLETHPRRPDIRAKLVELDENLVAAGEAMRDELGLTEQVEFVNGDATDPSHYRDLAPAHLVTMCGMLGLIDRKELPNIVQTMRRLCRPDGNIVWTRRLDWRGGRAQTKYLKGLMEKAGFRTNRYRTTSLQFPFMAPRNPRFAVATSRYGGEPADLPQSGALFAVSDAPIDR